MSGQHGVESDACACGPDECLNAGGPGCYFGEAPSAESDAGLERDPVDMADACLASWLTPGELQMRHERGRHEHCPPTWCEIAAAYAQADEQCKRPRAISAPPAEDRS
jgi:hypothetical protein